MVSSLRYKNIISGFFLTLTAVYCMFFLYKPGFIGYANNYDFIRHSSCIGLWSYIPGHAKVSAHATAPSAQLLYDADILVDNCLYSSDNVTSYVLTRFLSVGDIINFNILGSIKILLLLSLSFLAISFSKSKVVPSIILFSILTEWIYLAYANTLYGEFSVISAFTLVSICSYNLLYEKNDKYPVLQIAIITIAIFWLGLSKQQWSYLTFLILTIVFWLIYHRTTFKKTAFILLCLSIFSISASQIMSKNNLIIEASINSVNKINTFFYTVLPEAKNKKKALEVLGLPERCNTNIGFSSYHPDQNALTNCPEVQDVSRAKLLKLFIQDPATLFVPLVKFTEEMKLFYPDYLGLTTADDTHAFEKHKLIKNFSFSHIISKIDSSVFFIIFTILFISSFLTGLFLLLSPKKASLELSSYMYLLTIGGLTAGYSIVSSVFGDGYTEAAKHAVLFLGGVYLQIIGLVFSLLLLARLVFKK